MGRFGASPSVELRSYRNGPGVASAKRQCRLVAPSGDWGKSAISPLSEDKQTTGKWTDNDE
jgi:hypothetical protein